MKKAVIVFLGNPNYDTRTYNLYKSLTEIGISVRMIGFEWKDKNFATVKGKISIYKLNKSYSSLFYYLKFVSILKLLLFKERADYYFAEDVQTLPFVTFFGKMKGGKVFYDSRELYGFIAGLRDKKLLQNIIRSIEKIFVKKVDYVITTGDMDTEFIKKTYNLKNVFTLRNLPLYKDGIKPVDLRKKFKFPDGLKILVYQGVILHGRGLKIIFEALTKVKGYILIILGDGEETEHYKKLSESMGIDKIVLFAGKYNQEELINMTAGADIGLAIIENISLSYYYALPNKLFEYIMAGKPVITSNFPQMKDVIEKHQVGVTIDPQNIAELIHTLERFNSEPRLLESFQKNCKSASEILNWEKEFENLSRYL